jgi:hypothetical protein
MVVSTCSGKPSTILELASLMSTCSSELHVHYMIIIMILSFRRSLDDALNSCWRLGYSSSPSFLFLLLFTSSTRRGGVRSKKGGQARLAKRRRKKNETFGDITTPWRHTRMTLLTQSTSSIDDRRQQRTSFSMIDE